MVDGVEPFNSYLVLVRQGLWKMKQSSTVVSPNSVSYEGIGNVLGVLYAINDSYTIG